MGILLFTGGFFEKRSNVARPNYYKHLKMLKLPKFRNPVKVGTRLVIHKVPETVDNFWGFHFVKFMLANCRQSDSHAMVIYSQAGKQF